MRRKPKEGRKEGRGYVVRLIEEEEEEEDGIEVLDNVIYNGPAPGHEGERPHEDDALERTKNSD